MNGLDSDNDSDQDGVEVMDASTQELMSSEDFETGMQNSSALLQQGHPRPIRPLRTRLIGPTPNVTDVLPGFKRILRAIFPTRPLSATIFSVVQGLGHLQDKRNAENVPPRPTIRALPVNRILEFPDTEHQAASPVSAVDRGVIRLQTHQLENQQRVSLATTDVSSAPLVAAPTATDSPSMTTVCPHQEAWRVLWTTTMDSMKTELLIFKCLKDEDVHIPYFQWLKHYPVRVELHNWFLQQRNRLIIEDKYKTEVKTHFRADIRDVCYSRSSSKFFYTELPDDEVVLLDNTATFTCEGQRAAFAAGFLKLLGTPDLSNIVCEMIGLEDMSTLAGAFKNHYDEVAPILTPAVRVWFRFGRAWDVSVETIRGMLNARCIVTILLDNICTYCHHLADEEWRSKRRRTCFHCYLKANTRTFHASSLPHNDTQLSTVTELAHHFISYLQAAVVKAADILQIQPENVWSVLITNRCNCLKADLLHTELYQIDLMDATADHWEAIESWQSAQFRSLLYYGPIHEIADPSLRPVWHKAPGMVVRRTSNHWTHSAKWGDNYDHLYCHTNNGECLQELVKGVQLKFTKCGYTARTKTPWSFQWKAALWYLLGMRGCQEFNDVLIRAAQPQ